MATLVSAQPSSSICPSPAEIGSHCECHDSVHVMLCTDVQKAFKLTKSYQLKSLVVYNSPHIELIKEFETSSNMLHVDELTIMQQQASSAKIPENLESILHLSTGTMKIDSKKEFKQTLDVTNLPKHLTSLSINNVESLAGFDFIDYQKLETIELKGVNFAKPQSDLHLFMSPLTRIYISDSSTIIGGFLYQPMKCDSTTTQKIRIDLHRLKGLKTFDFSDLFKEGAAACHYSVDLSFNPDISPDLLTSQAPALIEMMRKHKNQLYLTLENVKLNCDCAVYDLYSENKDYIHNVYCENKKKFLGEITSRAELCSGQNNCICNCPKCN